MRISLNITNYSWPDRHAHRAGHAGQDELARELGRVARAADEAGLDTVWVADHLLQADPGSTPDAEMLEAYTTLGFLGAQTDRVRLGTMVTGVTFRPPSVLIKAVTTLDVLSSGRAWLGVGTGYHNDEARAMGLSLPPIAERFERLEETLQLATRMWSGDQAPFQGRHYRLDRPVGSPLPATRPRPPVLIGGMGERRTLPLVAQYADACNLFDIPDEGKTVRHKLAVLAEHCEAIGRPYDEIDKTLSTWMGPDERPEEFARRCTALADSGIEHVVAITNGPWNADRITALGHAAATLDDR